MPSEYSGV